MKFVFYVIDLDDGTIEGTNDVEVADTFVENDQYIILHQSGIYFLGSRTEKQVTEIEVDSTDDSNDEEG